jgi:UDP-N-acetylmuramate dehydrogenase
MEIKENVSLLNYNSFGIDVKSRLYAEISDPEALIEFDSEQKFMILGGGSDVLFTKDYDGLILRNVYKGLELIDENREHVWLKAHSGEVWQDIVVYAVQRNWGGIENLAYIPGTAGAAPIQNIGAYGVEIKDSLEYVELYSFSEKKMLRYSNEDCCFGYRNSVFKKNAGKEYYITSIVLKLNKFPVLKTDYQDIQAYLQGTQTKIENPESIADIITEIRKNKLPDPEFLGNAGSFFKNPFVSRNHFEQLKKEYPGLKGYPLAKDMVKLQAAQLIELCGWKNIRKNNVGVHEKQALVIVNYGEAKGADVYDYAMAIRKNIKDTFDVSLEAEVIII